MKLPVARTAELIEQQADKELLIYDLRTNKAYSLNETSKNIFKACGEKMSLADLRVSRNYTDDLIYLTLDKLKACDLLENYESFHFAGLSRREAIKKVGLASMIVLPVISPIIVPTALHAASSGCVTAGVCYASGTVYCPPSCNETINFNVYGSTGGLCNSGSNAVTLNCATPSNKGVPGDFDYRRV